MSVPPPSPVSLSLSLLIRKRLKCLKTKAVFVRSDIGAESDGGYCIIVESVDIPVPVSMLGSWVLQIWARGQSHMNASDGEH
ncbi:hypothetical protein SAY86_013201 [Trapa natans]|uniref:Uncharacterized protein n=1 Tax=Trapa natans TaxID=22666 RepID=A0AAN7LZD3_TRANT|nr:hypothetical protein SAY86_013201 [Trapa natans]